MKLAQAVKMAAKSISSNKGRSALTMLGIIIGLAAVIILVSYAEGQNMAIRKYYESMASNTVQVYAYDWRGNTNVSKLLYDYCLTLDEYALGFSPVGQIWQDITIKYEAKTISRNRNSGWYGGGMTVSVSGGGSYGEEEYPNIIMGNEQYGMCNDYEIARGRDLTYLDVEKENMVCVLGSATAETLFSFADPVGKTITLNGTPFVVVGVYQSKSGDSTPVDENDYWLQQSTKQLDRLVLLPSSMTRLFNNNQPVDQFVIKAKDTDSIRYVITLVNGYLSGIIKEDSGHFFVESPTTWQNQNNEANAMQQRFLGGIAAISLLVGGIGIMNIMLVTVTERTREIGIRKAIGAERRSIITQFLVEAAMICGIGGALGIGVGYVGTMVVGKVSFNTILIPSPAVTAGAAAISIIIGIIFGLYPAVKASGLQPVVALRAD